MVVNYHIYACIHIYNIYRHIYIDINTYTYSGGTYVSMHMGAKDGHEDRRVGRELEGTQGERLLVPDKNPRVEVPPVCKGGSYDTYGIRGEKKKKRQENYVCVCAYVRVHSAVCVPACARVSLLYWARWRGRAKVEPGSLSFVRKGCGSMSMD